MDGNDDLEQYSRIPTLEDLVTLCRNLWLMILRVSVDSSERSDRA